MNDGNRVALITICEAEGLAAQYIRISGDFLWKFMRPRFVLMSGNVFHISLHFAALRLAFIKTKERRQVTRWQAHCDDSLHYLILYEKKKKGQKLDTKLFDSARFTCLDTILENSIRVFWRINCFILIASISTASSSSIIINCLAINFNSSGKISRFLAKIRWWTTNH